MPLYLHAPPTGYGDTAEAWVSTSGLVARMNFALDLAAGRVRGVSVPARQASAGRDTVLESSPPAWCPPGSRPRRGGRRSRCRGRRPRARGRAAAGLAGVPEEVRSDAHAPLLPEVLRPGVRLLRPRAAGSPPLGAGRRGRAPEEDARRRVPARRLRRRSTPSCPTARNTIAACGRRSPCPLRARGSTDAALDLDGFFGLHPALSRSRDLWAERSLAIVHAVGSPDHTRSHFDAQDFMESGTPGVKSTRDGWMNRHLQTQPAPAATPFRAVALTPTLPRSLAGRAPAVAMAGMRALRGAGRRAAPSSGCTRRKRAARVDDTGREAFEALAVLQRADPGRHAPAAGAVVSARAAGATACVRSPSS